MDPENPGDPAAGSPGFAAGRLTRSLLSWRALGQIVVSAGLLALLVTKVDTSELSHAFTGGLGIILLVWLLQSALPFVQAVRWRLVAEALDARIPYKAAVRNVYVGQFFNQILPSSIGGDVVRVWKSMRFMPVSVALSSIALDRLVALIAVPIILAVGSGMLLHIVPAGPFRWSLLALIAAAGGGLLLLLGADRIRLPATIRGLRIVEILYEVPRSARRLLSDRGCMARTVALSIVIHLGVGTSLWLLTLAHGVTAPLAAFLVLAPLITMVTTIPISVGGWGVREGVMVTALSLLDIPASTGLSISIQFGLIMLAVGIPGGVLVLVDQIRSTGAASPEGGFASSLPATAETR
jgi:uncharacterized protein (TIRG00374 family)